MQPDESTERLLSGYARARLPAVPDIHRQVWREIERRRATSAWSQIFSARAWTELLEQPRLAALALLIAVGGGVVPAALLAKVSSTRELGQKSIHFEVFSARASGGMASLLDENVRSRRNP